MKEIALVHPIRVKGTPLSVFRESPNQSWERLANGDYVIRPDGSPDEFVIPATGVKYEQRTRTLAVKK